MGSTPVLTDPIGYAIHLGLAQPLLQRHGFSLGNQVGFNTGPLALNFDRFLLEYDTPRAGTFAPLRFVPKGKVVVLGLITTKTGALEQADDLIRRIDEATRYVPIDQLALSPQCGFASVLQGNQLTPDEQWRKIDLMLAVVERVWGSSL